MARWTRTDDPAADLGEYESALEEEERRYPLCVLCGERILQEDAVRLGRRWFCDDCLDELREDILGD